MPRYFFHVMGGADLATDREGQELDSPAAAHQEAVAAARQIMAECLRSDMPLGLDRTMVITDANGDRVSEVTFRAALPAYDASR
jgi:hypothetical protein